MGRPTIPMSVKFERGVIPSSGCWLWRHPNTQSGYGDISHQGEHIAAHRYSYERFVGPIPSDKQIDHLCRNRACVNPRHLRVVTLAENVLCGVGITAVNKRKTRCKHGHEFTPENTMLFGKHRSCRACGNARARIYGAKWKYSKAPCVICEGIVKWRYCTPKATCSQACAAVLRWRTRRRA